MALVAFEVAQLLLAVVVVGAVVERLWSGLLGRPMRLRPEEDGAGRAQRQWVGHPGGVRVRRDRRRADPAPPVLVVLVRRRQWRWRCKVAFAAAFVAFGRVPVGLGPHLGVEGVRPRRRRPPRPGAVRPPRRDGRRGRLDGVGPPEQPVGLVVVELLLLVEGAPLVVAADEAAFFVALAAFVLPPPGGGLEREGGLVGRDGGRRRGGRRRRGGESDELPVDPLRAGVPRADAPGEDIVLGPRLAGAAARGL